MEGWKDCPICEGKGRLDDGEAWDEPGYAGRCSPCPTCEAHFKTVARYQGVMSLAADIVTYRGGHFDCDPAIPSALVARMIVLREALFPKESES